MTGGELTSGILFSCESQNTKNKRIERYFMRFLNELHEGDRINGIVCARQASLRQRRMENPMRILSYR